MRFPVWAALGALLLAVPGAQAQQASRTSDPADPSAPVPPTVYQSALAGDTPAPKDGPAPDKAWRAANDSVAGQTGHGEHPAPAPRKEEASQTPHRHH